MVRRDSRRQLRHDSFTEYGGKTVQHGAVATKYKLNTRRGGGKAGPRLGDGAPLQANVTVADGGWMAYENVLDPCEKKPRGFVWPFEAEEAGHRVARDPRLSLLQQAKHP